MSEAASLRLNQSISRILIVLLALLLLISFTGVASASSFGAGYYGANVPFGTATSIAVALSGNANLSLTPSGSNFTGTGSSTITVTTNDVNGYYLYAYCNGSSSLTSGSNTIAASSNVTEAALANNTWGYNTDGSGNYIGFKTSPVAITSATGPYTSGNATTVNYGVLTTSALPGGSYTAPVTYTVAAMSD